MEPWRLAIDTGGTFTDCLAIDPRGCTSRTKVLSSSAIRARAVSRPDGRTIHTDWAIPDAALVGAELLPLGVACPPVRIVSHAGGTLTIDADLHSLRSGDAFEVRTRWQPPILAARLITATPAHADLPPIHMRLATTRGTNALLERRIEPPVLFITSGFADLLNIGDQSRPDLFALDIVRPSPLHAAVVEVPGRIAPDGSVIEPLDEAAIEGPARNALAAGHPSAAVALLHAWANPDHERRIAAVLRRIGFPRVCTSAELSPLLGLLARTQTAVVNAALTRIVGDYLAGVEAQLGPRGRLLVMTSAGGLLSAADYRPKDALLSGPAGGLVGAAAAASEAGDAFERIITFDMGGTSTDVARCASTSRRAFPLTREHRVADARILAPAIAVESVASGGGSVCSIDRGTLRVGPESAGADPGPACYGAGGPLTITDCHLLLGRIAPEHFAIPIDRDAAAAQARRLLRLLNQDRPGAPLTLEQLLEGFLTIADERMADAIGRISIRQGEDPERHALLAYGGAGGLHACALADRLGIRTVLIPPDAGLLSARGLSAANLERHAAAQALTPLDQPGPWLTELIERLEHQAAEAVAREGVRPEAVTIARREATLRLRGQSASFDLPADDPADLARRFTSAYTRTFGHPPPPLPIEVESVLVTAAAPPSVGPAARAPFLPPATPRDAATPRTPAPPARPHDVADAATITTVHTRDDLPAGMPAPGPAILADPHATTYIPPGWTAERTGSGAIVLRAAAGRAARPDGSSPIALELFIAALTSIAQDMGEILRRTALSVNVKERLDYSCALLSPEGRLLVNAPHVPVHLGALGLCVRALAGSIEMAPGDTIITNHPAFGGSHLPDITLVTPIHARTPGGPRLIGFAASRAHHAEIGGIAPGSMPPGATRLSQEGVVIPPTHLVRADGPRFDAIDRTLRSAPHPSRAPEQNLADIRAALAANLHAHAAVEDLHARIGLDAAAAHAGALTDRAEARAREALAAIPPGVYAHADALDDGSPIAVRITIPDLHTSHTPHTHPAGGAPHAEHTRAVFDFDGSAPIHPGNANATPAITTAATLYILRLLAREQIPLNEGLLRAIDLRIPRGSILDPGDAWTLDDGPAVAAGNVETSQRIADTLLLALGLAAASQGTMNNVAFGNDTFGFYETIGGGAGATPAASGASAVHTHMTNTRITDAEVMEQRLPVRVRRFAIRRGSGGGGAHRGGDGIIRHIEFLQPVSCSILAQRQTLGPPGLGRGERGTPGKVWFSPGPGIPLEPAPTGRPVLFGSGSLLVIKTPGGGGWTPDQSGNCG